MLGNFACLIVENHQLILFFKINFQKKIGNIIRVANSLDPDQARQSGSKLFVKPIAEDTSRRRVNKITVKPVLSDHSKIDNTKILMTNGGLMKVKRIAGCSPGAICNTFDLH